MRASTTAVLVLALSACGLCASVSCQTVPCEDNETCTVGVVAPDGGDASLAETGAVVPGCERSPSETGSVLEDRCGIFVRADGNDGAAGTKGAAVKTITRGLALAKERGKSHVFICLNDAGYDELLTIDRAVALHGGLSCAGDSWGHITGRRSRIAPSTRGIVARITAGGVTLEDLEIVARDGLDPGESSVAVFASGAGELRIVRSRIVAGAGVKGADGVGVAPLPQATRGNPPNEGFGALSVECMCPDGLTRGGSGGTATDGAGAGGFPNLDAGPPDNGAGGKGGLADCSAETFAGLGRRGAAGTAGIGGGHAAGAGVLTANGWRPAAGEPGRSGNRGQGGGGGGARIKGGSGGGCGGCGGVGGAAGGGGGGSIAVLALNSAVSVRGTELLAYGAGAGGRGAAGQLGQSGGPFGVATADGCNGGTGGTGGNGGAGGGGAGGVSAGIVHMGPAPTLDTTTKITVASTTAAGGASGAGGVPGTAIAGVSQDVVAIP